MAGYVCVISGLRCYICVNAGIILLPPMLIYARIYKVRIRGDIAQLARAPALQAGGPGFESLYLHHMG